MNASTGTIDATKNTGQMGRADGYNNGGKKWEERYSYDSLGRLDLHAEHRGDNGTLVYRSDFDHDRYGNRMQSGGQNANVSYIPVVAADISTASNRITSNTIYDDAGNITTDAKFRGMYYEYDANSRMRWASPTASSVDQSRSVYDALGRRVQAVRWAGSTSEQTRHMIYDAFGRQVAEYQVGTGAGWMCDNVHRGSQVVAMEEPGEVCYLLGDRQGSKRVVLSNSGGVMARHDYLAYGQEVPSTIGMRDSATQKYGVADDARQRYAQTEGDKGTWLEHAKWRKMESDAGRWTSPDPYRTSMRKGNPQSMNRYAYTQNDPVNAVDPSGLEMIDAGYYGVEEVIQVNVYASRFTPFYHYDAIGMNIGDNFGMIFDGRPVPEFAEPPIPAPVSQGLSDCAMKIMGELFTNGSLDLTKIQLHTGIPVLIDTFAIIDVGAVTIGNDIYFKDGWQSLYNADPVAGLATLAHELWHSLQYKQAEDNGGSFQLMYLGAAAGAALAGGDAYNDNPFENEAETVEGQMADYIRQQYGTTPCATLGLSN